MPFPAAALGLQLGSSLLGGLGSRRAARQREQALQTGIRTIDAGYNRAEEFLDPRYQQEQSAMGRVNALLGLTDDEVDFDLFRNTPGYEFMLEEALRGTERTAAARGGLLSGNTLLDVAERTQGIADTTFNNYLSRLMGLQSQGADTNMANLATGRATNIANLLTGKGEARASGVEGVTNALIGGMEGAAGLLSDWQGGNAVRDLFSKQGKV